MQPQSSSDSFGAFLERLHHRGSVQSPVNTEPLIILRALVKGPLGIPELLAQTRVPVFQFSESLRMIGDAGLVRLEGPAGSETVQLTPTGEKVAAIAENR